MLFVDGLPKSATNGDHRKAFESIGRVEDVFISKKVRKNRIDGFGFFWYRDGSVTEDACKQLDGSLFFGKKLRVSMARYCKGGRPFSHKPFSVGEQRPTNRRIKFPAYRDSQRYSDVLMGK